jgi:hypothetical protein
LRFGLNCGLDRLFLGRDVRSLFFFDTSLES